jgi:hypothetical protein
VKMAVIQTVKWNIQKAKERFFCLSYSMVILLIH